MKKRVTAILLNLLLVVSLIIPVNVSAAEGEESFPRVMDQADLLAEEEEGELLKTLDEISEEYECDVVAVTTNDLEEKTPEEYADDFFDYNGYGFGEDHDGILLLVYVGPDENKWHITTTGRAIDVFYSQAQEHLSDNFLPYLSDQEFAKGFMSFANGCEEILNLDVNGEVYKEPLSPMWIFYSLIIGFTIAFLLASSKKAKMKSIVEQQSAQDYTREGSIKLNTHFDNFINKTVTSRIIESDSDDTHQGSSGTSHGGSGGSF